MVMVQTAVETVEQADALARALVEGRLAACVQVLPIRSTYRWEGALQQTNECLLLIKTTAARGPATMDAIRDRHPYTLPEILASPITDASPAYARWVTDETEPRT